MKNDEISSTEKLLDLIRNDSTPSADFSKKISPRDQGSEAPQGRTPVIFTAKEATTVVGVDLGYSEIRLVRVVQSFKGKMTLMAYRAIPYDPEIPESSPRFPSFLRKALSSFCPPPSQNLQIWTCLSAANVEVRRLLIPKVQKKQLAGTIFWAFKKEVPFKEKDYIFDFEVQGDVTDKGVQKTAVLAYIAPKNEIETKKEIFTRSGYPLAGITTTPFASQNIFRTNWSGADASKVICNLYIGREWSRIDIFSEGKLMLTRGIKTGTHSMAMELVSGLQDEAQAASEDAEQLSLDVLSIDSPPSLARDNISMEEALTILATFNNNPSATEDVTGRSFSGAEVFARIEPAAERLVRQLERTFEHFAATFTGETVTKTYLAGNMGAYDQLRDYIKGQLGIPCRSIDPFAPAIPHIKDVQVPSAVSEKSTFTVATGLALSNNDWTPNFLFTHKEKAAQVRETHIGRIILSVFLVVAIVCGGVFYYQTLSKNKRQRQLSQIERQLAQYDVSVDKNLIAAMKEKVKAKMLRAKKYGDRYRAMAVLSELSAITPDNISLNNGNYEEHVPSQTSHVQPGQKKQTKSAEQPSISRYINIQGVVFGPLQNLNATLSLYTANLAASPLFSDPRISNSEIITYKGNKVLVFTLTMDVL